MTMVELDAREKLRLAWDRARGTGIRGQYHHEGEPGCFISQLALIDGLLLVFPDNGQGRGDNVCSFDALCEHGGEVNRATANRLAELYAPE